MATLDSGIPNWLERLLGDTQARMMVLLRQSPKSINQLADSLALTDNAIRTHVAALARDGLVQQSGTERDTGGKPARVYGLTHDGEELFPKAYAVVLKKLIEEIAASDGPDRATELLRAVGQRVGSSAPRHDDLDARVTAAANALREIGGEIAVERTRTGWHLQGRGCPLSAVTGSRHETCEMARAMVQEVTGLAVSACESRGDRPNCGFAVGGVNAER